jgi:hypothetical protein
LELQRRLFNSSNANNGVELVGKFI